jgi:hypothetical protein
MNVTFDEMFPSKWLAVADLNGQDVKVTIAGLTHELLQDGGKKWCLHFRGTEKIFGLNKTNASTLRELFGEPSRWVNQQVILYPTTTDFKGVPTPCIRIRGVAPQEQRRAVRDAAVEMQAVPAHVTAVTGAPERFDDLDDAIPF